MKSFTAFYEVCEYQAKINKAKLAYCYLGGKHSQSTSLTFGELAQSAKVLASQLQSIGTTGDRALIICQQNMDYIKALWACLYSGVIAVPAYAPRNNRNFKRLETILKNAEVNIILLSRNQQESMQRHLAGSDLLHSTRLVVVDDVTASELIMGNKTTWIKPSPCPEDIVVLQYTSGSTGLAKGVMVSNKNLMVNEEMIMNTFGTNENSCGVFWIPLFHDMGLISLLQGVYAGYSTYIMSPMDFLRRPFIWFKAISDLRGTITAAPNYSYEYCAKKITSSQLREIDLSSIRAAINGSEPVLNKTMDEFSNLFKICGFKKEMFYPCYGLAEATLLVSGKRTYPLPVITADKIKTKNGRQVALDRVSCGAPPRDSQVLIVDNNTGEAVTDNTIGEIWVKGDHVAKGYWNNPRATLDSFQNYTTQGEGPFLKTGDLGFFNNGEVVVTGRLKDLIIIRGENYYPQDIEKTIISTHENLVSNGCAALSIDGDDYIQIVAEVKRNSTEATLAEIERSIAFEISATYGLQVDDITLTRQGCILKTSSGKIQRKATQEALLNGQLVRLNVNKSPMTDSLLPNRSETLGLIEGASADKKKKVISGVVLTFIADELAVPFYVIDTEQVITGIGIDSISLVKLVGKIESQLGVDLPLDIFFGNSTVAEIIETITRKVLSRDSVRSVVTPKPTSAYSKPVGEFPASLGQSALWFIQNSERNSSHYNEGAVARVEGNLNHKMLENSLILLAKQHDALRCRFVEVDSQPVQVFGEVLAHSFSHSVVSDETQAFVIASKTLNKPFNLCKETWRCHIVESEGATYLALAFHHIVFDMWSYGIFVSNLKEVYDALSEGVPTEKITQRTGFVRSYADYTKWQRGWLNSKSARTQLEYWKTQLECAPPLSTFPSFHSRSIDSLYKGQQRKVVFDESFLDCIKEFSIKSNLTTYQFMFAAFSLLLSRYSSQEEVVIGMPSLGRSRSEYLDTIGYFVNVLPIRVKVSPDQMTLEWLESVREAISSGIQHQDIPLPKIIEMAAPERSDTHSPLIQVLFTQISSQEYGKDNLTPFVLGDLGGQIELGDVILKSCEYKRNRAQFDLSFSIIEKENNIIGLVNYREDLYSSSLINRIIKNYTNLLRSICDQMNSSIADISLVDETELREIRSVLTRETSETPSNKTGTVIDWFKHSALISASRIALMSDTVKLTYRQLDLESDYLARLLINKGIGRCDRVALGFDSRVLQTLAGVAVLKAGAVFVPIDLSNPKDRISFMLKNSRAKLILSETPSVAKLPDSAVAVLCIEKLRSDTQGFEDSDIDLDVPINESQAAYCVYTSGSTGQPKGVLVTHKGLKNLVGWHIDAFELSVTTRASMVAGAGFDVAVMEVWPHLCTGSGLFEPSWEEKGSAENLFSWLNKNAITHCFMATSLAEAFLEYLSTGFRTTSLQYLLTAGERLKIFRNRDDEFTFVNMYGPAENSPITTSGEIGDTECFECQRGLFPDVGLPIYNQSLYILDENLKPVPLGVAGELYIYGDGLAQGYTNLPGKTAEVFLPNPFSVSPGTRMYATGDVVCLDEKYRLQYIGRTDDQVQIRGFRVEPGEVESVFINHPLVSQCKVITLDVEPIGTILAAYVVFKSSSDGPVKDSLIKPMLHEYLRKKLPHYMVPASITIMETLPVDANGKINKFLLPTVSLAKNTNNRSVEFKDQIELKIANIFSDVLGIKNIGSNDDFFALGGHSLLAAKVVNKINSEFGLAITIGQFFEHSKICDLSLYAQIRKADEPALSLTKLDRPENIPLSAAQKRLWFLQQYDTTSTDYNITGVVRLNGPLNPHYLENAINCVVARHESLRVIFPLLNGEPVQQVLHTLHVELIHDSITDTESAINIEDVVNVLHAEWKNHSFDLANGPLLRLKYSEVDKDTGYLFLSIHHIVADGKSIEIIINELNAYYGYQRPSIPEFQFIDYVLCCQSEQFKKREKEASSYWSERFAEPIPRLPLSSLADIVDKHDATSSYKKRRNPRGNEIRVALPMECVARIRMLAKDWGVTEFMIYLTTYVLVLSKYGNQQDVMVGTPYDGRDIPGLEGMVGFFVNVLPIRVSVTDHDKFSGLVLKVRDSCLAAFKHGQIDYEKLAEIIAGTEKRHDIIDLVHAVFDFEHYLPVSFPLGEARAHLIRTKDTSAKFDLTLKCSLEKSQASVAINYKTTLFDEGFIKKLLASYVLILEQLAKNPDICTFDTRLVNDGETQNLIQLGAGPVRELPEKTVSQQFERLADSHPEWLAVVSDDGSLRLTYGHLNKLANKLSVYLRSRGLRKGDVCAVCLNPKNHFVASILAILKLGAAYLAIDPRYPGYRKNQMLENSQAVLVISDMNTGPNKYLAGTKSVIWEDIQESLAKLPEENLNVETTLDDLAYLVYTSGTSGTPKGISTPHRGLTNLCQWHARQYGLLTAPHLIRASQTSGIGFDAAVWEIWPYLSSGASVWFAPKSARVSSERMTRWLTEQKITHCFLTTPLVHQIIADQWSGSNDLRFLLTGGEKLTTRGLDAAKYRLVNHYGPSETSVVTTCSDVIPGDDRNCFPPIGTAIDNVSLYVLDRHRQLVPQGIAGELYVSGVSLMNEYRGDAELTHAKLVRNEHSKNLDSRMYKTGDLVWWNIQGELEYVGRIDNQIKIRGYRIEPNEILGVIKSIPFVRDATVTTFEHEHLGTHLVAHLVVNEELTDTDNISNKVKSKIAELLPEFMVPAYLIILDNLPVNDNGKVDVHKLPRPQYFDQRPHLNLTSVMEKSLAEIWTELLGCTVDNANANFFELGGQSLLAARAVALIESRLQREISLRGYFEADNLASLAETLSHAQTSVQLPKASKSGLVPLSPFQKRLWIVQNFEPHNTEYNVVGGLKFIGLLDVNSLEKSIIKLVDRHEALRTNIQELDGGVFQKVYSGDNFEKCYSFNVWDMLEKEQRAQTELLKDMFGRLSSEPFNLAEGPLFRLELLRLSKSSSMLLVCFHHIIVDGWSVNLLLRDLLEFYESSVQKRAPRLSSLNTQYRDYSYWSNQRAIAGEKKLIQFWKNYLSFLPVQKSLPYSVISQDKKCRTGETIRLNLETTLFEQLKLLARRSSATLFELMLSSYCLWLHQLTRDAELVIGIPFNDRGKLELEEVVGFFVNILPVRCSIKAHLSFQQLLEHVKKHLRQVYSHYELPFDQIAEHCTDEKNTLFQTMFDLQDKVINKYKLGNLEVEGIETENEAPIADLTLTIRKTESSLQVSCTYVKELFNRHTVDLWLRNYCLLLEGIISKPNSRLDRLPFLTPEEQATRLIFEQKLPISYDHALLHQSLERVAISSASDPAITTNREIITFGELYDQTNQIANYLIAQGVGPGDVVGIEAVRSVYSVRAILAVIKAGAAYLILDSKLPKDRLHLMMTDSCCRFLFSEFTVKIDAHSPCRLIKGEPWSEHPAAPPVVDITPDCPVVLHYTSGSTGKPKATVLHHRGIVNYLNAIQTRYNYQSKDRVLLFAPLSFDASLEEIFAPLSAGASVHISDEALASSVPAFIEVCQKQNISVLTLPTAYWRILTDYLNKEPDTRLTHVRLLSIGGEKASIEAVKQWKKVAGGIELWNVYGPSECSVGAVVDRIDQLEDASKYVPFSSPIANTELYILDSELLPVPTAVIGEVYVAGAGIAYGYHDRPALTAAKFIPNPFVDDGSRLFRSGDIARYDLNGKIQFLGRSDFQVKVDGIRVEPEDIASVLETHPQIIQGFVSALKEREDTNPLVGYVTVNPSKSDNGKGGLNESQILAYLRHRLPTHMIPASIIILDEFPLTVNQKVDRKKLPLPKKIKRIIDLPQTDVEKYLCSLWQELMTLEDVGVCESFFSVGGSSLLAIRLSTRIEAHFALRIAIKTVFEHPTIREMAKYIETVWQCKDYDINKEEATGNTTLFSPIKACSDTQLALSGAQYRIWYLNQMDPYSSAYNLPDILVLEGALHVKLLQRAIRTIINKHESLRTIFRVEDGEPVQIIIDNMDVLIKQYGLSGNNAQIDIDCSIDTIVRAELEKTFDLTTGPLVSFSLIREHKNKHVLLSIFHHIIMDGWSIELFNRDLAYYYNLFRSGTAEPSRVFSNNRKPFKYRDFAQWHNQLLNGGERKRQINYWKDNLCGQLPILQLPTDFPRTRERTNNGAFSSFVLTRDLSTRLIAFSQSQNTSPFMVLFSAYFCLLYRYTYQEDLLVAIPAHGRSREELETIIGFFVNTLVIRIGVDRDVTFPELLARVSSTCLDAFDHQDISLEEIMAEVNVSRDLGINPIFQTMFSYQEAGSLGKASFDGLATSNIELAHHSAKFDLYLATWLEDNVLRGGIEFSTDIFEPATVERIIGHYINILTGIVENPMRSISYYPILSDLEYRELIHDKNKILSHTLNKELSHHVFEKQVARYPDHIAVKCGTKSLSYAALNESANRVAQALILNEARPENRVALILDRNIAYLISMLGALKAGVPFTPIDPNGPHQRMLDITCQRDIGYVIFEEKYQVLTKKLDRGQTFLELEELVRSDGSSINNPNIELCENSLAYVIYTSGSTGKPKGVMIEHGGMLNHLKAKVSDLKLNESDVIAQTAVTTFDVSIWQYLAALLVGGKTVIIENDTVCLPCQLLAQLAEKKVTVFESVPSHMKVINDELEARSTEYDLKHLRVYISNAEALTSDQCNRWFKYLPGVPIVNTYGATECSDDTSHYHIHGCSQTTLPYVSIHGTLPNLATYVLDTDLQPVPIGVTGEVYIGGKGVGRGYIHDPVRTAESFLPDPYSNEPGRRFYKTGDLARYHADGKLEYFGRVDYQIKIRGQRVEIGEIEYTICRHANIRQAIVLANRDSRGNTYLVGYVNPSNHPAPTSLDIKLFLDTRLPSHMVPLAFIFIDEFPLSENGKIDRKKLPLPSETELFSHRDYQAPQSSTEKKLAELWETLLEVKTVGRTDSFFALGGHSLLAAEHIITIQTIFGMNIKLRTLFEAPRLMDFAVILDEALKSNRSAVPVGVEKLPPRPYYKLAPCQVAEWYAYQMDSESPVYNICIADLFFKGKINHAAFLASWNAILERHEVFHLKFGYKDGQPIQFIDYRASLTADDVFIDRKSLSVKEIMPEANRLAGEMGTAPFDFENGPLFRLHLVSYRGQLHQLIFVIHHIIWDETSLMNLTAELSELYNAYVDRRHPVLPELKVSYFDYVQWMRESLRSGVFDNHKRYWLELFEKLPPPLDIPTDYPRPNLMTYRGDAIQTWLPRTTVRNIESFIKKNDITLFMVKLALLDYYLYRITGQEDFVIGCPIAGRSDEKLKPLLGLFATPLPIRCNITPNMTFRQLLRQVSQRTMEAFEHYHYPASQVIEQLRHTKDLSRPKLFSVMFGVQNNKTDLMNNLAFNDLELSFEDVLDTENKSSRFDLTFVVDKYGSDIMFSCIYNTDLFHKQTATLMLEHMTTVVDQIIDQPDMVLHQYSMIHRDNKKGDPDVGFGPRLAYDTLATIQHLIELQASRTPQNTAIRFDDVDYDYELLNTKANQLGHLLMSLGVAAGGKIMIMMTPSFEMIVSLLAVLKTGCCFIPVGIDYPQKRIDMILRNSDADLALIQSEYQNAFTSFCNQLVYIDLVFESLHGYSDDNLEFVDPNNLAYIIHTSGTTASPKGIQIEHGGVVNMLAAIQHRYDLTSRDRVLFHTPYTFDVFIQDVFWPLANGAVVVIAPKELPRSAKGLGEMIDREAITLVQVVPLVLEALVDDREKGSLSDLNSLRQVICGGSALSRKLSEKFALLFECGLANHYGPTEVTVDACWFDSSHSFSGDMVPIGLPIANSRILILDEHKNLLPKGIIGEIYIQSPGLARGYLNDIGNTKNVFVEMEIEGKTCRLFKTGDLGKYDGSGLINFHGRKDQQIKIRGNRVELDEISSELVAHPDVAAVGIKYLQHGDTKGQLVAYIEQTQENNHVQIGTDRYYYFTLEQRPELRQSTEEFQAISWPVSFQSEPTICSRWSALKSEFPEYQFAITDGSDRPILVGNSVPILLDCTNNKITRPKCFGWADALERAFSQRAQGVQANTLYAFIGVAGDNSDQLDLAEVLIEQYSKLAKTMGLTNVVFAKRLPEEAEYPAIEGLPGEKDRQNTLTDNTYLSHPRENIKHSILVNDSLRISCTKPHRSKYPQQGSELMSNDSTNALGATQDNGESNKVARSESCLLWWASVDNVQQKRTRLTRNTIRNYLRESLPDYMIPELVHFISYVRLTDTGKVDVKSLPKIELVNLPAQQLACTDVQLELKKMWEALLETEVASIRSDFFELGGQSLKAIELISSINKLYDIEIELRQFYIDPTILYLEELINESLAPRVLH